MTRRIGPTRKRQRGRLHFFLFSFSLAEEPTMSLGGLMLGFSVSRTAMFAEPAVTEIEEVVCLVHGSEKTEYRSQNTEYRIQKSEYRIQETEFRIQDSGFSRKK
jgi:hypothetical protein